LAIDERPALGKEQRDRVYHELLLRRRQFGIDRQRQGFTRGAFALREIARPAAVALYCLIAARRSTR
jgi:hypothetical protein